jgi:hypothetical protein
MNVRRVKVLAAVIGSGAAIALTVIGVTDNDHGAPAANLAGSGDAATSTNYLPPTVSHMVLTPTAMSTGATTAPTTPATAALVMATPTVTPSAAAPCANNGVVLPGGCH